MKKAILGALFMGAMFASCSSDEPVVDNGGNNSEGGFLALNVLAPSSTSSRATDSGFETGSDAENAAPQGTFLLFDASGTQTQAPQKLNLSWEPANDPADPEANREKISEAVLVINEVEEGDDNLSATEILVILNAPADADFEDMSKSEVLATVGDYSTTSNFIMTNSVYSANCAAKIAGKVMKTPEAAKANPVDIYVERVLAKVRTNKPSEMTGKKATVTIGDEEIELDINITGIEVANMANKSYLYKNGFATWGSYAGATDAGNYRSYWATSAENETGFAYANQSYNEITAGFNADNTFSTYVQENTNQNANKQTSILVTAELKKKDGSTLTFVRWGGKDWAEDGFGANASNVLNDTYRVKKTVGTQTQYNSLPSDVFEWIPASDHPADFKVWENSMRIKKGTTFDGELVKITKTNGEITGEATTVEAVNATLQSVLKVLMWNQGKAYYFVNIESWLKDDEGNCRQGVVRNHIYDLALGQISGVGVPVWDPEQDIIPEKPDESELFYLAARINILKWKYVKQTVNFN